MSKADDATLLASLRGQTGLDWPRVVAALRDASMDHGAGSCLAGVRQLPAGCSVQVDRAGAFQSGLARSADHDGARFSAWRADRSNPLKTRRYFSLYLAR